MDGELRRLERQGHGAATRLLAQRLRAGTLDRARLELAAYLGDPGARELLGHGHPAGATSLEQWIRGLARWGDDVLAWGVLVGSAEVHRRARDVEPGFICPGEWHRGAASPAGCRSCGRGARFSGPAGAASLRCPDRENVEALEQSLWFPAFAEEAVRRRIARHLVPWALGQGSVTGSAAGIRERLVRGSLALRQVAIAAHLGDLRAAAALGGGAATIAFNLRWGLGEVTRDMGALGGVGDLDVCGRAALAAARAVLPCVRVREMNPPLERALAAARQALDCPCEQHRIAAAAAAAALGVDPGSLDHATSNARFAAQDAALAAAAANRAGAALHASNAGIHAAAALHFAEGGDFTRARPVERFLALARVRVAVGAELLPRVLC